MNKDLKKIKEKLEILKKYGHALSLISYDFETICPKNALEEESEVMNFLSNEYFKIFNSDEMKQLIVSLYKDLDSTEDELDKELIRKLYKSYLKSKNITPEFDLRMNKIYTKAHIDWLKAKEKEDYSLFKDSLKQVFGITKEAVELRENKLPNLYDNLLDDHEEGVLTKDLDGFFKELKEGIINLLSKIKSSSHIIRDDFLSREVPINKQEQFSNYLLKLNGYDFNSGCLGTTEHPFTTSISKNDARVTTHYHLNLVLSNMYSVIHEGGHAIFMQGERSEDHKHYINNYITSGMHESVSRFYENIIGRSKEYVHLIYPKFKELFNDEFSDVSERELYEAINIVKPSLIRTEADEVTYSLHIIIRYEIEKMICEGKLSFDDAPKMWNKLYKDYLGVEVSNDTEGILQDVHWTSGFGYFPSYALGNAYNAMYVEKLNEEFSLKDAVAKGNFKKIKKWMKDNVFVHANVLTPKQWLYEITKKELSPMAFLNYLNNKYSKIYLF